MNLNLSVIIKTGQINDEEEQGLGLGKKEGIMIY